MSVVDVSFYGNAGSIVAGFVPSLAGVFLALSVNIPRSGKACIAPDLVGTDVVVVTSVFLSFVAPAASPAYGPGSFGLLTVGLSLVFGYSGLVFSSSRTVTVLLNVFTAFLSVGYFGR